MEDRRQVDKASASRGTTESLRIFARTAVLFLAAPVLSVLAMSGACAETLVVPGSGNPQYLLSALANAFNDKQSQHRVIVPVSSGTAGAIRDVASGNASLGRVGRPLTPEEQAQGLRYTPIGRDPVVFVGGSGVTLRNITRDQVAQIFKGTISDWKELGGTPGAIRPITREPSDASARGIRRALPDFGNGPYPGEVKLVHLDHQLIELLDRYRFSFGFLNKSGLKAAKSKLTEFDFESVPPTLENVASGRYPFWIEMGLIFRPANLSDAGRAFIAFIASPEGANIIRGLGVEPIGAAR